MKVRRYLRGSGRVLAFVFVASVIWLLFDMAALRLSINDVNSQLLKERVIREREVLKQQSRVTQLMNMGFKHPVQRVDLAATHAGKGALNPAVKLSNVYRRGGKQRGRMLPQGNNVLKSDSSKSLASKRRDGGALYSNITQKQGVPASKKAVNLDLHADKVTQVPPSGQKVKATQKIKADHAHDSEANERAKDELTKAGTKQAHLAKTTPRQPANKDVNRKEVDVEEKEVRKKDLNAEKKPPKLAASLQAGVNNTTTAVRKPGVHKVLSLDVTSSPRDANALGQFGQAVVVNSDQDAEVRKRWNEGHFNVYLSDQIPVDRAIPDTRPDV